ncbi:MAG: hypothetical protein ACKOBP_14880, partial [Planctomycetia bacterium]
MRWLGLALCMGAAVAAGPAWERVRLDGGRVVDARVVVEALDGSLLIEHRDQRLEVVPSADVGERESIESPAASPTPRELGADVLRTLPEGFDQLATRHYVICFDTSRDYAKWAGALFERLHEAFVAYWRRAGLDVDDPARPLVVVIHADRRDDEASVTRD